MFGTYIGNNRVLVSTKWGGILLTLSKIKRNDKELYIGCG